jgi:hypothetical protein
MINYRGFRNIILHSNLKSDDPGIPQSLSIDIGQRSIAPTKEPNNEFSMSAADTAYFGSVEVESLADQMARGFDVDMNSVLDEFSSIIGYEGLCSSSFACLYIYSRCQR